jgi:hypothetical protein
MSPVQYDIGAAYAILRHALRRTATWLSLTIEQTLIRKRFSYFQGNLSRLLRFNVWTMTGIYGQPAVSSRRCLAICL